VAIKNVVAICSAVYHCFEKAFNAEVIKSTASVVVPRPADASIADCSRTVIASSAVIQAE
jgi:hypothetical protein